MLSTLINLLPVISILISLYIFHLLKKEKDANSLIEDNQVLIEKYILKNQKNITKLEKELSKYRDSISSLKLTLVSDFKSMQSKVDDLYERWSILSDDRITSIPQNNKDWWEAKQIVAQAPQKVWKTKNLSQTKSGFINENTKYIEEEEINQDFSELSDEDFENILDDESDDTSSSGDTDNLQQQTPKPRKAKPKTM